MLIVLIVLIVMARNSIIWLRMSTNLSVDHKAKAFQQVYHTFHVIEGCLLGLRKDQNVVDVGYQTHAHFLKKGQY